MRRQGDGGCGVGGFDGGTAVVAEGATLLDADTLAEAAAPEADCSGAMAVALALGSGPAEAV